jgi:hypothetical protein
MFRHLLLLTFLAAATAPGQARFEIEGGDRFDFGNLYTIIPVSRDLTIRNSGDDTLKIKNVSGSCGCTGTLLSSSSIPPGGEGTLKITFDPAKFTGGVEKVVSMHTNDPKEPNPHIYFTATIVQILGLDQDHLVFYTEPDSQTATIVTIRNVSEVPVTITGVTSSPPDVATELPESLLPPGGETALLCTIRPANPGILRGDLLITTDHPLLPTLTIRWFSYAKRNGAASGSNGGR